MRNSRDHGDISQEEGCWRGRTKYPGFCKVNLSHLAFHHFILVLCRCRPLNTSEKEARSYSVVDCPNSREVTVKETKSSSVTKTFQFDKVFGHQSKQIEVYRSVVEPLLLQVSYAIS